MSQDDFFDPDVEENNIFEDRASTLEKGLTDRGAFAPVDPLDKMIGHEDKIKVASPMEMVAQGVTEPPGFLPACPAALVCLRGPCEHYWSFTVRFDAQSDQVLRGFVRQCNAHAEPTDLLDQNIFWCSLWWPAWLSWVPRSFRPWLRAKLQRLWEWYLRVVKKEDFSWKTWTRDDLPDSHVREIASEQVPKKQKAEGVTIRSESSYETGDISHGKSNNDDLFF